MKSNAILHLRYVRSIRTKKLFVVGGQFSYLPLALGLDWKDHSSAASVMWPVSKSTTDGFRVVQ